MIFDFEITFLYLFLSIYFLVNWLFYINMYFILFIVILMFDFVSLSCYHTSYSLIYKLRNNTSMVIILSKILFDLVRVIVSF